MAYVQVVKLRKSNFSFKLYVAVGVGGIIGSTLRFLVSLILQTESVSAFPWATLTVNLTGAFILTFILFLPALKNKMNRTLFTALTTGLIGSYTTFSTITVEVVMMWQKSVFIASTYLFLTIFGGLLCSFFGFKAASRFNRERIRT